MAIRVTNAVLAEKIDNLAQDMEELKREYRQINGDQRIMERRVTVLETRESNPGEENTRWTLENPRILLMAMAAIMGLIELLGWALKN